MILYYQKGFKGQIVKKIIVQTPIFPVEDVSRTWASLDRQGMLTIEAGFAYDFSSGPTVEYPEFVRCAAGIHDALCYLHRKALIDERQRKQADQFFYAILKANGSKLWAFRWYVWYRGVRLESGREHHPKPIHQIECKIPGVDA
jgi:hypothetical protein